MGTTNLQTGEVEGNKSHKPGRVSLAEMMRENKREPKVTAELQHEKWTNNQYNYFKELLVYTRSDTQLYNISIVYQVNFSLQRCESDLNKLYFTAVLMYVNLPISRVIKLKVIFTSYQNPSMLVLTLFWP